MEPGGAWPKISSMSNRTGLRVVAIALSLSFIARVGSAEPSPREKASAHAESGRSAFDQGDLLLAEKEYSESLALVKTLTPPEPKIEIDLIQNLSRINEKLGRLELAIEQAQIILADPEIDTRERDEHVGRIARMRELLNIRNLSIPSPPKLKPRYPKGAVVLVGVGAGLVATSIGCGAGIPGFISRLDNGVTYPQAEQIAGDVRALQTCGAVFGAIGGGMLVGGFAWLGWSLSRNK